MTPSSQHQCHIFDQASPSVEGTRTRGAGNWES